MCNLKKYTDIYPDGRIVHHFEHELCSRSRHGKPCDRVQTFNYPDVTPDPEPTNPRITYEHFPPTPPRSSRSPSISDSDRSRRSNAYYVSDSKAIDVNHKPSSPRREKAETAYVESRRLSRSPPQHSSPRREKAEHVTFADSKPLSRSLPQRYHESGRRPPSPSEDDFDVYESSHRMNIVGKGRDEERKGDRSADRSSERDSDRGSERNSDRHSDHYSDRHSDRHSERSSERGSEHDSEHHSTSSTRPVKRVTIVEDPSHKKHRREGSKTSSRDNNDKDEDRDSSNTSKVRYYTPGESLQHRIDRQNEEIANRPAAVTVAAPAARANHHQQRQPKHEPPQVQPQQKQQNVKYRRGSVQVNDVMTLASTMQDLQLTRIEAMEKAREKERRRQEREIREETRGMQQRLKERLQRRNTLDASPGALVAPRRGRQDKSIYL
ncbi:hypothetical protein DL766_001021 [Monosporascus sp. MC13-8B]|uniref:Uncharacterized protein n=1 Tax=Monosporascus cannonballus TaxID=155416 RepID=A0ABY0H6Q4_9PEZI|nr:hypothetical protein DL763_010665 [Monosporascus cannonballus]RYO86364.1 hypothetical protein DL762_004780 [Monosporascus cannonballus]RYP38312.1 hypothetical protein DL766_001021 [Monosporascus sp. MC13-8B]